MGERERERRTTTTTTTTTMKRFGVRGRTPKIGSARARRSTRPVMAQSAQSSSEVTIRRYPPAGKDKQSCGRLLEFEVPGEEDEKPRNILEEIVWFKNEEIARHREKMDLVSLKRKMNFTPPARDFIGAIKAKYEETGKPGLIAEVKRASPSKGLCKEFIIEAYQIFHARAKGADAILLIAAVLPNSDLSYFIKAAKSLGMAALVEVHSVVEMQRVLQLEEVELIGINNRDLETFKVDLYNTKELLDEATLKQLEERDIICVGESGIFTPEDVKVVQDAGCKAILVGESLVKEDDIEGAVEQLLS